MKSPIWRYHGDLFSLLVSLQNLNKLALNWAYADGFAITRIGNPSISGHPLPSSNSKQTAPRMRHGQEIESGWVKAHRYQSSDE